MDKKIINKILVILLSSLLVFTACGSNEESEEQVESTTNQIEEVQEQSNATSLKDIDIPEYIGSPYCVINDNEPFFTDDEKNDDSAFETYSDLDSLGRCGVAFANICHEIMPNEKRGNISNIHPTGWHSNMNWQRCHLIGYQLAGENANEKNLITGTQYMNVSGMLPFENMVDDYIDETDNHVLYRVTPLFKDDNLIASGVEMEAWSVEDNGDGICFNVYCYNVSKSAKIDYATGVVKSTKEKTQVKSSNNKSKSGKAVYWTESGQVYHSTKECSTLSRSKVIYKGTIEESGKSRACKVCY